MNTFGNVRRRVLAGILVVALLSCGATWRGTTGPAEDLWATDEVPPPKPALLTNEQVERQLDAEVSLAFDDTPLAQVVAFIEAVTDVRSFLYPQDVPEDISVTLHIETPLRTALDEICALTETAWRVKDGVIEVGSPDRIRPYELRVYDVADLLEDAHHRKGLPSFAREEAHDARHKLESRARALQKLVGETVRPESWAGRGGIGVAGEPGEMAVIQTADVHAEIEGLLAGLRGQPGPQTRKGEELQVTKRLKQTVRLAFDDTPLSPVVDYLQEVTGVDFSLCRQDVPIEAAVTVHAETDLRTALDLICSLCGLAWKVEGPVVRIAHPRRLEKYELRVHDVGALLRQMVGDAADFDKNKETVFAHARALRRLIMETVTPASWADGQPRQERHAFRYGPETVTGANWGWLGPELPVFRYVPETPAGRAFYLAGDPTKLAVIQIPQEHAEVEKLLRMLAAPGAAEEETAKERKLKEGLQEEIALAFDETPLSQVVEFLREIAGLNVVLYRQDVEWDAVITLDFQGELRAALDEICRQVGLAWKVEGSVIKIADLSRLKGLPSKAGLLAQYARLMQDEQNREQGTGVRGQ